MSYKKLFIRVSVVVIMITISWFLIDLIFFKIGHNVEVAKGEVVDDMITELASYIDIEEIEITYLYQRQQVRVKIITTSEYKDSVTVAKLSQEVLNYTRTHFNSFKDSANNLFMLKDSKLKLSIKKPYSLFYEVVFEGEI